MACLGSGGLIASERTVMRWALSLDRITTTRPLCIPTPDACDAHETQEIQRERQRQFCSTMGFFLLDQCNRFLDQTVEGETERGRRNRRALRASPPRT